MAYILTTDSDELGRDMREWAKVDDVWHRFEFDDDTEFVESLYSCDVLFIDSVEVDHGVPGHSYIEIEITTDEPDALRAWIRSKVAELIWARRDWIREERSHGARFYPVRKSEKEKERDEELFVKMMNNEGVIHSSGLYLKERGMRDINEEE